MDAAGWVLGGHSDTVSIGSRCIPGEIFFQVLVLVQGGGGGGGGHSHRPCLG